MSARPTTIGRKAVWSLCLGGGALGGRVGGAAGSDVLQACSCGVFDMSFPHAGCLVVINRNFSAYDHCKYEEVDVLVAGVSVLPSLSTHPMLRHKPNC